MGEGECEPLPEEQPRKSRHRKKHLYNMILHQMEFYFSDSNLTKDRFLSQLITESPYVDIEIFLKFNKIIKLNCTIEDIQKAIGKSDIIELSEDGMKIHRKKPIKVKENVDNCTIYIENIKADATHDTLSQIFSDFGNVVYVSIPKYKHNRANKGFAFVEYETEEQANEAISFFESIGCKISSDKNPEELRSIATFEGDESIKLLQENQDLKVEKMDDSSDISNTSKATAKIEEHTNKEIETSSENSKKRKLSTEDSEDNKNLKTNDEVADANEKMDDSSDISNTSKVTEKIKEDTNKEIETSSENSKKRKLSTEDSEDNKNLKTNDEVADANEKVDDSSDISNTSKVTEKIEEHTSKEIETSSENSKKRKLSTEDSEDNKKLKTNDEVADANEENDGKKKKNKKEKRKNYIRDLGMQILTKKEWKKLRNRYLDLQKKKMREFKHYLNRQKFSQKGYDKKKNQTEEKEGVKDNKEKEEVMEEVKKLSYTPGVIVKLKLQEPCMDVKKLKNEIKSVSPEVKYVDIPLPAGSEEVFIRFTTSDVAKGFCNKDFNGEKTVIEGEEEKNYWDKIENDRTVKFQKSTKKQRGREKLLKKAEKESSKHLRFDETDL